MSRRLWYVIALLLFTALPAAAQQILLDQPLRAGELTLFPDLNDPNVYYYVSDKPHLAIDANGAPQFSFLRWVENVRSGADQPDARQGEGGGIVHALVALSVTPGQLQDAQRELQRVKPGARIRGPVVFKSGRFGLVSSFKDSGGRLSEQVVGLGSAPILDGEKAAVSILLTKLGAKVLWESFNTPTPDISFSFEMNMTGFRSPKRALIEANFDQIYEHHMFGVGLATTYVAAEIKGAFDDLQRSGAIKVTQVGSDEKMEGLISTAYNKITGMMFDPIGGTGTPSLESLTAKAAGGASLLDRATTMLAKNREAARAADKACSSSGTAPKSTAPSGSTAKTMPATGGSGAKPLVGAERPPSGAATGSGTGASLSTGSAAKTAPATGTSAQSTTVGSEGTPPATGGSDAKPAVGEVKPAASAAAGSGTGASLSTGSAAKTAPVTEIITQLTTTGAGGTPPASGGGRPASNAVTGSGTGSSSSTGSKATTTPAAGTDIQPKTADVAKTTPAGCEQGKSSGPSFAVVAAYEMKKVRQRGTFKIDLNKFTTDDLTLRFDENIGDLRSLHGDAGHFHEVNLDDPLYQQREISAYVDGANAQDFDQFINFVSVRLRKKHARGMETTDEIRIDRANFNKSGNNFKLMYGWKDDNDRRKWMEYDYQATWSFFGGRTVEQPWRTSTAGGITLAPPYQRHSVDVQADPTAISTAGVRAITVKVFYNLGGNESIKQLTLLPSKAQLSGRIDFILPADSYDYDYEVSWRLPGDKTVTSSRKTTNETVLLLDTVPET